MPNILGIALEQCSKRMRAEGARALKIAETEGPDTPVGIVAHVLAHLHEEAALIYDDALAVLVNGPCFEEKEPRQC